MADNGEFTMRAFLNGKMDLSQAEAVADIINASSEIAAKSAAKSLQGNFSKEINNLLERKYFKMLLDPNHEERDYK